MILYSLALILSFPTYPLNGTSFLSERQYVEYFCPGRIEFSLPNRSRVDCLTEFHAIEFDKAKKWYEAAGQALYYSSVTDRKPMVVLITNSERDIKYVERLQNTINYHRLNIEVIVISSEQKALMKGHEYISN